MVQHQELDLTVGDVVRIGDTIVTVIDIDDGEITLRFDDLDAHDDEHRTARIETFSIPR